MTIEPKDLGQIESFYQGFTENYDSELNEREEEAGNREINLKKIDNIVFDQIDFKDSPDFSDAYILSADMNGVPMSDLELDALNEERDFVHTELLKYLY